MTTTEPTTGTEQTDPRSSFGDDLLALVDRVTEPEVDRLIAELEELREKVTPVAERAAEVMRGCERQRESLTAAIRERYPRPSISSGAVDGLGEFVDYVTGYARLWEVVASLGDMLDPEEIVRSEWKAGE